jgi:hypothetical protein
LLTAWESLKGRMPLKSVEENPSRDRVFRAAEDLPGIEVLGGRSLEKVHGLIWKASPLVSLSSSTKPSGAWPQKRLRKARR